ncbi:hypothetical protein [Campylobacter jejuni]|uniref:hypothetical protein n=1 Tax=Campylobacter jejuni TaxID=197 RepID=UPI00313D1741
MIKTQFNEIKERLTQWRNERHLTYENQQAGFLGNVFEEISEYFRAKNDLEKIDALCDIAVFCFNVNDVKFSNYECYMKSDKVDCEFFDIVSKINSIIIYKANFKESPVKVFLDTLIALLHKKCKNLGFDFYKCMLETIKEIESREQDPEQKKEWEYKIKNKIEIKDKWRKNNHQKEETKYKANYESCRLLK